MKPVLSEFREKQGGDPAPRASRCYCCSSSSAGLQAQSDAEKADIRWVLGHMVFGGLYRDLPRRAVCITMLRDPVDRPFSHYAYVSRIPEHSPHREVVSRRLALADDADSELTGELNDGQVGLRSGWPRAMPRLRYEVDGRGVEVNG